MKPGVFAYVAPTSLVEVARLLREHGPQGKILAGGQSLVPMLRLRQVEPAVVIDINGVPGLDAISDGGHWFECGALVRHRAVIDDPRIAGWSPLLAEAAPLIGNPAVRNRGTIVGSLAHAGFATEWPVAAVALDADVIVANAGGAETSVKASRFFRDRHVTVLEPGQWVRAVRFPKQTVREGQAFREVAGRPGDVAYALAAARVTVDAAGRWQAVRLALGGVAPTPLGFADGDFPGLIGRTGAAADIRAAVGGVVARVPGVSDMHARARYRLEVAVEVAAGALLAAAARAAENEIRG